MTFALDVIVRSTLVLVVATILCLLLSRASASTRHAVWLIALLSAVALPFASRLLPSINFPVPVEQPPVATGGNHRSLVVTTQKVDEVVTTTERWLPPVAAISAEPRNWSGYAVMIWIAGVIVIFTRLLLGIRKVRALIRGATPADDSESVPVVIVRGNFAPMTTGFFRSVILLPSRAVEWSEECRRLVLAHELAHVKRHDGIAQIVVQSICALYWFNPLVWYASRRLQLERERACDDRVLALGAAPDIYAKHLLDVARAVSSGREFASVAPSMVYASQLETRLRSIIDGRCRRRALSRLMTTIIVCAGALFTFSLSTIRLIAFPLPQLLQVSLHPPALERAVTPVPGVTQSLFTSDSFVRVAAGEFMMGCASGEGCSALEAPPHTVQITKSFEIGKYEVTQAQWQSLMGTNPSDFRGPDLPVEQVSWSDIQEFLTKLNAQHDGYRYRLPSEAEWEFAARAGGRMNWFSGPMVPRFDSNAISPLDEIAWTGRNAEGHTHPVGQKRPNAWGIFDMLGNVSELTEDWYSDDYFRNGPSADPAGPPSGYGHVVRGLSWELPISPRFRYDIGSALKYDFIGFRVVREAM